MTFYIPIRLGRNATQDAVNSLTIKLVRAYINIAFQVTGSKSWVCAMSNVFTKMFKADTFISLNKFMLQLTNDDKGWWPQSKRKVSRKNQPQELPSGLGNLTRRPQTKPRPGGSEWLAVSPRQSSYHQTSSSLLDMKYQISKWKVSENAIGLLWFPSF